MEDLLPDWPPAATDLDISQLLTDSRDYALSHSILYRPVQPSSTSAIHAPFSLFPSPFPKKLYDRVVRLQTAYNELYAEIASDHAFLEKVIGGNVIKVDEFQERLYRIWMKLREEGEAQPLQLGLFRSDYLLHSPPSTLSSTSPSAEMHIKQVEFNTISSSFGGLSSKVTELHRHLARTSAVYQTAKPPITLDALPLNPATQKLARGLAEAHKAYGKQDAKILFVVQPNERNVFDQRALEYELEEAHGIQVVRMTLDHLGAQGLLDPETKRLVVIPHISKIDSAASVKSDVEISVIYYRAGYSPDDYKIERDWAVREMLEESRAIKCPSVGLQLAGAKKIQQVLCEEGVLESFAGRLGWSQDTIASMRETFVGIYSLEDTEVGNKNLSLAYSSPEKYVLKPQREGGGNNIYRTDIPAYLDKLAEKDKSKEEVQDEPKLREGYILMELIQPPEKSRNALVRAGEEKEKVGDVVSELGIYGICLFDGRKEKKRIVVNEEAGHLLRTKGRESDEGGVAVGFSVVDSPFLV